MWLPYATLSRASSLCICFHSHASGVPKLSPSMYPFSILIDEHVPLNMSARRIFSREGPIVHFPGVGQNIFAWGNKCGKIWFSPHETKKTPFYQKIWWENVKFKNAGAALAPPSDAHAPKTSHDKKTGEDNKNILTNTHIMILNNNIHWYLFYYFNIWTRHEVRRAQARTICTTRIDNNSHRTVCTGAGGWTTGLQTLVRWHFAEHYIAETFLT